MINNSKKRFMSAVLIAALTLPIVGDTGKSIFGYQEVAASTLHSPVKGSIVYNTYEEKLKEAEKKRKELEEKKKKTQENIARLNEKKNDILKYIEQLDGQLNELTDSLDQLAVDIKDTKADLKQTEKELKAAKEKESKQYDIMKKRIQYLYENGSDDIMEVFLSSGNIIDFLNQIEYSKKISEYDGNLLNEYIETKELIQKQEEYQKVKLSELTAQEEEQKFEQQTLLDLSAEKGREIERYTQAIGVDEESFCEYADQLTAVNADIDQIKKEEQKRIEEQKRKAEEERKAALALKQQQEEEAKKQQANQGGSASSNVPITNETSISKMIWPLPGDGRVYSKFGPRIAPCAGASTYHYGVDIGGAMGAPIVASLSGKVVTAVYSTSAGNYVNIDHGNGIVTRYLHCSKLLVSVGDYVSQGQVIAKVGSTGISTGPHLHFGMIVNGTYVDPLDYISYK